MKNLFNLIIPYSATKSQYDAGFQMDYTHSHYTYEVFYVVKGVMQLDYIDKNDGCEKRVYLYENQFVILSPNITHKMAAISSLKFLLFEFSTFDKSPTLHDLLKKQNLDSYLPINNFLNNLKDLLVLDDVRNVKQALSELVDFLFMYFKKELDCLQNIEYYSLLLKLLIEICRCSLVNDNKTGNIYINKAINYINSNYANKISLKDISDFVGITPQYLLKLFKSTQKKTIMSTINEKRLEKATELLTKSKLSISEIGGKVGFAQLRSFQSAFTKKFGLSPSEYRKKYSRSDFQYYTDYESLYPLVIEKHNESEESK